MHDCIYIVCVMNFPCMTVFVTRGGTTGEVQLRQLASDWAIIIRPRPPTLYVFAESNQWLIAWAAPHPSYLLWFVTYLCLISKPASDYYMYVHAGNTLQAAPCFFCSACRVFESWTYRCLWAPLQFYYCPPPPSRTRWSIVSQWLLLKGWWKWPGTMTAGL